METKEQNKAMMKDFLNSKSANSLMKMKLQMFADGGEGDEDPDDENPDGDDNPGDTDLSDEGLPKTKSELDALINKANQKALDNQRKKLYDDEQLQKAVQAALQKEKDYSKLSEDERKQKEFEEQQEKFKQERAEFEYQKLVTDVKGDLVERGLPTTFAETLAVEGDTEKSLEAVKEFEKAFKEAVAAEVKKSLKQPTPGVGSNGGTKQSLGERLAKKSTATKGNIFGEE